jgi:hypothetical protein
MSTFLDNDEIATLTGRKIKSKQIQQLRTMGITFRINATGHPVVTRSTIEANKEPPQQRKWTPNVLRGA